MTGHQPSYTNPQIFLSSVLNERMMEWICQLLVGSTISGVGGDDASPIIITEAGQQAAVCWTVTQGQIGETAGELVGIGGDDGDSSSS